MDAAAIHEWWRVQENLQFLPQIRTNFDEVMARRVVSHVAWAVKDNDADFFERIAIILRARRKKQSLTKITAKDLLYDRKPGRAAPAYSLACCFPTALSKLLIDRTMDFGGGVNRARITRDELRATVRQKQLEAGLEDPPLISNSELSRWLKRTSFQRFMAEQPIARKVPKNV